MSSTPPASVSCSSLSTAATASPATFHAALPTDAAPLWATFAALRAIACSYWTVWPAAAALHSAVCWPPAVPSNVTRCQNPGGSRIVEDATKPGSPSTISSVIKSPSIIQPGSPSTVSSVIENPSIIPSIAKIAAQP
ncbi:hypothetical protein EV702DRAFT_1204697 [Suillus placidus]|uniref:Uncharacterized protein n=1 Tax=Suillus placidus TaxID=48579 RepID=A0A9P6ZHE5_9AGAM|nr:hypothetical protein EV702DRAFT_1204697 [Suillus placidus]